MHVRKFDRRFTRRVFMKGLGTAGISTGVLQPLWPTLEAHGDPTRAYPDHLNSLEEYTAGAINTGDVIDASNVEHVRDLLDPIRYEQISTMGRVLNTRAPTTDIMKLGPWEYLEATFRNRGQARFDSTGNVRTSDGGAWIGGNPFPDPVSAVEVFAGHTLSWGRHDVSLYTSREFDLDASGNLDYRYESVWAEMTPVGRLVIDPKPHWPGHEDILRYQSVIFTAPHENRGTSFLSVWPYDQREFPDLRGYIPAFKRVRSYPTNQRFEPLIAGSTLYLSDAWAAGDPFLTWGDYRIVHRGPALAAVSNNWSGPEDDWSHGTHGGQRGLSWWDMTVELVPEAIVIEARPTSFPRAPISKKRVWFDARTLLPFVMVSYDRRGEVFRSFDGAYSVYDRGEDQVMDGVHPYWSWTHLHGHNIQTGQITRIEQVARIPGGHQMLVNDPSVYNRYLTTHALRRFGN